MDFISPLKYLSGGKRAKVFALLLNGAVARIINFWRKNDAKYFAFSSVTDPTGMLPQKNACLSSVFLPKA